MATLGEELRKQRELRQVSLREISDATKINIRFLEALERNDFTHLPGGQFNKGFIRAYARYIGIDAERMIDAYEELRRTREMPPDTSFPEPETPVRDRRWLALAACVLILALAILAAIWLVRRTWFSPTPQPPEPVAGTETTGVTRAGLPAPGHAVPSFHAPEKIVIPGRTDARLRHL